MPEDLPKAERQMISRARGILTRLVGMKKGDQMADELFASRSSRYATPTPDREDGR